MITSRKQLRIRSLFDHILIGLVIVFGTMAVSQFGQLRPDITILEKIQYWFLCDRQ